MPDITLRERTAYHLELFLYPYVQGGKSLAYPLVNVQEEQYRKTGTGKISGVAFQQDMTSSQ